MDKVIEKYIIQNMEKLTAKYVKEYKNDVNIDISTLKKADKLPEHLVFIARTCGTYLLFRNKDSADTIINFYKADYGARYYIFNTKKHIAYKKINWQKALEYTKEYPED